MCTPRSLCSLQLCTTLTDVHLSLIWRVRDAEATKVNDQPQIRATALVQVHLGDEIGNGCFGTTYKGRWRNMECAVKVCPRPFDTHWARHLQTTFILA